jgi:SAM-dependent methyltransferase
VPRRGLGDRVPWWLKLAAKLLLARLPVPDAAWQRFGLFRHGAMDDPQYPIEVFHAHVRRSGITSPHGIRVLELGPGNSIATAVIAAAHSSSAVLVDSGAFATQDLSFYQNLSAALSEQGLPSPDLRCATSLDEILALCGAQYLTNGLESLAQISDSSVDLIFSQAVLEHIRSDEFEPTFRELSRILAPGGISSHRVDLQDHLGGGLNNLRFSRRIWESPLFAGSGFYTNRLGVNDIQSIMERTHDRVWIAPTGTWASVPLAKARMHRDFRLRSDSELSIFGFDALLSNLP